MTTALKDRYNQDFFILFKEALNKVTPAVDTSNLFEQIFTRAFEKYELKDRMYHVSSVLKEILSEDFVTACDQIIDCVAQLKKLGIAENFEYMFLPDYVASHGLNQFELAMHTLSKITSFTSAEFAVRPFILKYPEKAINKMYAWSTHSDPKIRRLASEGSRPRLPWAMALPELKRDPSPALPILENLKNDPDEIVRRSVANHLNDICKDNPKIAFELATKWHGQTSETTALVKHGIRTLLKQGHTGALALFGLDASGLEVTSFEIHNTHVNMGERLSFSFDLLKTVSEAKNVRIEFALHLLKQNGSHSKKVFKISERSMTTPLLSIEKQHHIKPITTRVYYAGEHFVSVIINGKEFERLSFMLSV